MPVAREATSTASSVPGAAGAASVRVDAAPGRGEHLRLDRVFDEGWRSSSAKEYVSMQSSVATTDMAEPQPAGHLQWTEAQRSERLREVPTLELVGDLLLRIGDNDGLTHGTESTWLGSRLLSALRRHLDVHQNRCSRQRYCDSFATFYRAVEPHPVITDKVWVEVGCGSTNPAGVLFLFLMLGARRGIAIDLDRVQEPGAAVEALADLAAMMLVDPASIVGDHPIDRAQLLANLQGFDLGKLRRGDLAGVAADRLEYRNESLHRLSLGDGEADYVFSNAFLEHVPDFDRGVAELARIAKPGSLQCHNIDTSDHRRYNDPVGPLEFLHERGDAELVIGSNRLRLHQIVASFERHGFDVLSTPVYFSEPVTEAQRQRFAEPFRSMTLEQLRPVCFRLVARRR